jgi:hypothetical protein
MGPPRSPGCSPYRSCNELVVLVVVFITGVVVVSDVEQQTGCEREGFLVVVPSRA